MQVSNNIMSNQNYNSHSCEKNHSTSHGKNFDHHSPNCNSDFFSPSLSSSPSTNRNFRISQILTDRIYHPSIDYESIHNKNNDIDFDFNRINHQNFTSNENRNLKLNDGQRKELRMHSDDDEDVTMSICSEEDDQKQIYEDQTEEYKERSKILKLKNNSQINDVDEIMIKRQEKEELNNNNNNHNNYEDDNKDDNDEDDDDDDDEHALTIDEDDDGEEHSFQNNETPVYQQKNHAHCQYTIAQKGQRKDKTESSDTISMKPYSSSKKRKTIIQKGEIPSLEIPRKESSQPKKQNSCIPLSLLISPRNESAADYNVTSRFPFSTDSSLTSSSSQCSNQLPPIRDLIKIAEKRHLEQQQQQIKQQQEWKNQSRKEMENSSLKQRRYSLPERSSLPSSIPSSASTSFYSPSPYSSSSSSISLPKSPQKGSRNMKSPRSARTSPRRSHEDQRSYSQFRPYPYPNSSPISSSSSVESSPGQVPGSPYPTTPPPTPEERNPTRFRAHKHYRSEPNLSVLEHPESHHKFYSPPSHEKRNLSGSDIREDEAAERRHLSLSPTSSTSPTSFSPRKRRGVRSQSISVGAQQLRGQFTRQQLLEALAKHKVGGDRTKRPGNGKSVESGTKNTEK